MLIGYARVSTVEQETALQLDALRAAGVALIFAEKTSGVGPRPELHRALASMRSGDVLMVYKIDRLARSLQDLLSVIERLKAAGCAFRSLTEPIDTGSALGELNLQMLGAFAQFERSMIRERVIAGQVAAIKRGVRHGRPPVLDDAARAEVARRYSAGGVTMKALAQEYGVGRWVIERAVYVAANPTKGRFAPRRPVLGPLLNG